MGVKFPVLRIAYREFTMSDGSFTDRDRIATLDQRVAEAADELIEEARASARREPVGSPPCTV